MIFYSIIIPTLNAEKDIQKCINSVLNQKFVDYELIFIDGGSTDGTLEILYNIPKEYKFKIVNQNSIGIYQAMNLGLEHASGKWIYFLGADDYFSSSETLLKVSKFAERNGELKVIYGRITTEEFLPKYKEFDLQTLLEINICHQSIFVQSEAFKKLGNFNIKYSVWADYEHNWRWFGNKKVCPYGYIDEIIAVYGNKGYSTNRVDFNFIIDKPVLLVRHLHFAKNDPNVLNALEEAFNYLIQQKKYFKSLIYTLNFANFGISAVVKKWRDWFYLLRKSHSL